MGVEAGLNNVSRWMTWLPISLKNAVKCDKWYQLQNHSITESLNANGAWEKLFRVIPVHAIFSVSNKQIIHVPSLYLSLSLFLSFPRASLSLFYRRRKGERAGEERGEREDDHLWGRGFNSTPIYIYISLHAVSSVCVCVYVYVCVRVC